MSHTRWIAPVVLLAALAVQAPATIGIRPCTWIQFNRLNSRLRGEVLDFTANHGADRRIYSPALDARRDLYVYLPPGFDCRRQYPIMIAMHGIAQDEHFFLRLFEDLDQAIVCGKIPPMIIATPDGSVRGRASFLVPGSFYLNSKAGRFEDYIVQDVWCFLTKNFPIRPEREFHILAGASMGGFAAFNLGFKYPETFKLLAGIAPPLNLRYADCHGRYFANFDPNCTMYRDSLRPLQPIARFSGIFPIRERRLTAPLFSRGREGMREIAAENPVEMLDAYGIQPGQFDMFVGYGGRDEFNIDAQVESFVYIARQRGLEIEVAVDPRGHHTPATGLRLFPNFTRWLGPLLRGYEAALGQSECQLTPEAPAAAKNAHSAP